MNKSFLLQPDFFLSVTSNFVTARAFGIMKLFFTIILLLVMVSFSKAQNTFTNNGSNVGIGTTTPAAKLEIVGTGANIFIDNSQFSLNRNPLTGAVVDPTKGAAALVMTPNPSGSNFQFYTNFATGGTVYERMRIAENGNIGIGTNTPSAKLTVKGNGTIGNTGVSAIADLFGTNDRTRLTIGNSTTTQGGSRSSAITFYGMKDDGSNYKTNWEIGNDYTVSGINDFYIFSADLNNTPLFITALGNVGSAPKFQVRINLQ
jgi:hypothetical protein